LRCHDDRQPVRWREPTAADRTASAICPIVAMKGDVVAFGYDPTPERFPPIWGARSGELNNALALSFRQPHRIPTG
jgi:hypothetical protein